MADTQTQNTPETQQVTVDELSNKIRETTNELNTLKNWLSNLSAEELQQKADELSDIEHTIAECMEDLSCLEKDWSASISKSQLDTLRSQINTLTTSKDAVQAQIENQTRAKLDSLKWNIAQVQNNWESQEWDGKDWEEKGKWWKTWLRIWWIWLAWWWVFRLWKRIFGKKDKQETTTSASTIETKKSRRELRRERREQRRKERAERRANRPRRQKFLIWSAIAGGTTFAWIKIYKNWNTIKAWVKEKLWLWLSFDEALVKVETEVKNWIMKDTNLWSFAGHFEDWLKYNESTQEICSYWQTTKIDKKNRKIVWLESVSFPNREQLIHAANIINFSRFMLAWSWETDKPFVVQWGDICFKAKWEWKTKFIDASWNSLWSWILWWTWAVAGWILWRYAWAVPWAAIWAVGWWCAWAAWWAVIDNKSTMNDVCSTLRKWANLDRFVSLLNEQKNDKWESLWKWVAMPEKEPDDTTPIHKYLNGTIDAIAYSYDERSGLNGIKAEMIEWDPSRYKITSYDEHVELKLEWCTAQKWEEIDFSKITKIRIWKYEWDFCIAGEDPYLDLEFPNTQEWLQEAIRVINLTNSIRRNYKGGCAEEFPFSYWDVFHKNDRWKNTLTVDLPWAWWHTLIKNEEDYPTLTKDLKKSRNGTFVNKWLGAGFQYLRSSFDGYKEHRYNVATWKEENKWSKYINYLHQMWWANLDFNYWKKPQ